MFLFVVAAFVLPSLAVGFWLGQRANRARMHRVGVVVGIDTAGFPIPSWEYPLVPMGMPLYIHDFDILRKEEET